MHLPGRLSAPGLEAGGLEDRGLKTLRVLTLNLWGENGPWEARLALVDKRLEAMRPT